MLRERMYVRCPADIESMTDPRVFVCGQITKIDEFKKTVTVKIHDPFDFLLFFEDMPKGLVEVPIGIVDHCSMFPNSEVMVRGERCTILSEQQSKDGFYYYYVQNVTNKTVYRVSEKEITASFTNGKIDPTIQLQRYEFQNPCWYMGHAVVSRSMNILKNSIYGFKELAGSKIYLLPHQVNTIMRCLQQSPCRYMLADEVGMGKTIEAISILKIFMQNHANRNALIVVPETLKEQWKTELLLKFNISVGIGRSNNTVTIKSISEISSIDLSEQWDFVIIDEVHRYLPNKAQYSVLHKISLAASNILILSATPVQQRKEEYLDLLRLLQPEKYDSFNLDHFSELVNKQSKIIQKTALILDNVGDYEEEIGNAIESGIDPHDSEECRELFEEIYDDLEVICNELSDKKLTSILQKISYEDEKLGVQQIKVIISYICSNYQIESNIIRNRRKILEINDDGTRLLPSRELSTISYALDADKNYYEAVCYQILTDLLTKNAGVIEVETVIKPLLGAFFSSPWAFSSQVKKIFKSFKNISIELLNYADKWVVAEDHLVNNISEVLDDPGAYESDLCTRLVSVMNLLFDELFDKKIVVFTNYIETFEAYRNAMEKVFPAEEISFFSAGLSSSEVELNAYRFQNEATCRIMLCDYTGGEGRNFQCADYIVHIDLPWDANMIEQRIGRLDRLERDPSRSIVTSVVVHTVNTFEEALFKFWSNGLKIFTQSLSGMEIIMKDINNEITAAVEKDFKYGLFERVPKIIDLADSMRETIRKEQNYDAASFIFRPMYVELKRLIDYYAKNENDLFASTMTNWASLAGFRGFGGNSGVVTYTSASFSPKSAINSQLIPPRWNDYLNSSQNKFLNSVNDAYNKSKEIKSYDRAIKGTFIRKKAIENDYLHFFAPGDEVFDCIVNNAINSCKGKSSAFAVPSEIDWKGFIFTWSIAPNEAYLLDNGVSAHALGPYRNFMMSEQVVVASSLENPDSISDDAVVREFVKIVNAGFNKGKTIHLGKRSRSARYLNDKITGATNVSWFKAEYPEEVWLEIIANANKSAYEKAFSQFKHRSNIRGAREEMERTLSARIANSEFYGVSDDTIDALKKEQDVLIEAIKRPKVALDSVAFVWMVKEANGQVET
ncbi:DEAD/DEAH box helicase family protein [Proteiniclasticum sp. BAD-10]|uniref:DEAD/DEAH box helicase family protein n=1 Tax=Proteiniclasticum sediminis TaxID=2804028 RepID=A0A941HQQ5_9CLOT|nr:SNF2-related protein [Proteiniclasticum sediminis]MBR0576250.1 DEAD/DEAH box helicase family protein [Proteiniclasticum sediminis]